MSRAGVFFGGVRKNYIKKKIITEGKMKKAKKTKAALAVLGTGAFILGAAVTYMKFDCIYACCKRNMRRMKRKLRMC